MMKVHGPPLLLLAALAGGCMTSPAPPTVRPVEVDAALQSAARHVRRCYRAPRVSSQARQIVTRVRVRLSQDGQLVGLPILLWQSGVTPANRPFAGRMGEAAIEAVLRCTPIHLPPALHARGWNVFDLTFSPLAAA
jgi:hypothetical protein